MSGYMDARLKQLGIDLPDAPAPAANYVPYILAGDMLYVSGQISQMNGTLIVGRLGEDMAVEEGVAAARACGISILAQVRKACQGNLERVKQVVKLTGFVNSTPDFTDQPKVINGCSDLMVAVFNKFGPHARSAVGVASLPLGVAVEIEAIFQIG